MLDRSSRGAASSNDGAQAPAVSEPDLFVRLDVELPDEVAVGAGTALFVCGWCFHPRAAVRELRFVLDGVRQPTMAHGMPRLDPFAELHPGLDPYEAGALAADPGSVEDPELRSYASGFWGLVRIEPGAAAGRERLELWLEAALEDGRVAGAPLAAIGVIGSEDDSPASPPPVDAAPGDGPLVAICMATHNPPPDLLEIQLESIRSQTQRRWVCLISDDGSSAEAFAALQRAAEGDSRFTVSRAPAPLGFYRNFERALSMVPPEADFVALSDQDDRWHEDKLHTLVASIGEAKLVYSDARIVSRTGETLSETYWSRRRNNHSDMLSLLVANSVSGSATLVRRELLDDALPFPPAQFAHYHDHWLALVALALGEIAFVERPLYDYVQHGQAALGHEAANRMPGLRERLRRHNRRDQIRLWRLHYFVDACRLLQCVAILQLRCGDRMPRARRRALERFMAAEHSPAPLAVLAYRGARELSSRGRPETLGAEWVLFRAFSWSRLVRATARNRPQRHLRLDAVPPPDLAPRPAPRGAAASASTAPATTAVRAVAAKIAPLTLAPAASEPVRINLLVPTIDLEHFFGGYIAKFNLARRLAARGLRVRIVTVDPTGRLPRTWRRSVESYAGLEGTFDAVEVAFGREQSPLAVNPADRFIATTWWTAHIAGAATRSLSGAPFLYLIQEYEPFTFPMGTYAALARQSYELPHTALFSSELLRDYFRGHRLGVFAGEGGGEAGSAAFQNAITAVPAPTGAELSARRGHRVLFYARPEAHAARNLFELGVLGLARAVAEGALRGWEINGIGSLQGSTPLDLGSGAVLNLLARAGQDDYAALLREHDVGLALMYTPHPSLVPVEMAAAGMLTVTSTFENKTAEAMAEISPNLLAVEPTVEAIAGALADAAAGVTDHQRRVRGSAVRWSRDWDQSFDSELLDWVAARLG
jgi:glycosyltransferase involved in cell wall biosynthesis